MNLIELEYKTQELLQLWSLLPVQKQVWMVFETLTKMVSLNPRMFHSYTEQWLSEFPEQLEAEDIAGLSPDIWLSLYNEWVKELNEIWPDKKLEIIGIEKVEQVFTDRRITQLKTDPMVIHKAKWVWKRKNGWLGWASLFVSFMVLAF